jgi:hypothetical protein
VIFDLLLRSEFPRVRVPPPESREVLRLLRCLLVEAAHTAAKRDEGLGPFYRRLVYRRGRRKRR